MTKFLESTDEGAFVDHPLCEQPPVMGYTKPCPVCKQHGGWNLQLNAYGLPFGTEDTAANRHRYVHFRTICGHCDGWGFIREDEQCEGHEWAFDTNLGRCYNRYKCIKCGKHKDVDSSD